MPKKTTALLVVLVGALVVGWLARQSPAPSTELHRFPSDGREAPDLSALRGAGGDPWAYRPEPVFGDTEFGQVLMTRQPADDGPILVLEQTGLLWSIAPDGGSRTKILDLSDRVHFEQGNEAGALGLAFRPKQADLFLFYVTERDGELFDRVARFEWNGDIVDPASERVLIEQNHGRHRRLDFAEHFGGHLEFGPDGFLYVAFGDEGWVPDRTNPQKLGKDLFAGILRLDVDCDPGRSHPAPRQPETGTTQGYCIPNDNPFVGVPDALEEFYLIGLRNPWRFSFDRETHQLWIGDAGSDHAEEINVGTPGGNYQWSYREGVERYDNSYLKGNRPKPFYGVEREPLFAYPHGGGNGCIIGGHVYRGQEHPDLVGHYIFGDINSGRIWALLADTHGQVLRVDPITRVPPYSLLSFGELADGEILLLGRPKVGIAKLVAGSANRAAPPPLSKTGLFRDVSTLEPARGVVPYQPKVPSWTDGATKSHWAAIPGDGSKKGAKVRRDRVVYRKNGPWAFPSGSVFVQHLELPIDETTPDVTRPVETRVLVLSSDLGARGYSYVWNEEGTDAYPVERATTVEHRMRTATGEERVVEWPVPDPSDCMTCHHLANGYVLGLTTRQLDQPYRYDGAESEVSQLLAWNRANLISGSGLELIRLGENELPPSLPLRKPDDTTSPLADRARSYLDANCAFCHGPAGALFDIRREAPIAPLVGRPVRHDFGHEGASLLEPGQPERSLLYQRLASDDPSEQMPPIGRTHHDPEGAALIREWIAAMPRPALQP